MIDGLLPRRALEVTREHVASARMVVVNGPPQVGTSSLLRRIAAELHNARYISLDDTSDLRTSRINPAGFVEHDGTLLIDEVQPGGDPLVLAIKSRVDRSDQRGQFLVVGSTRFLTEPRLSESLPGRARFVDRWPLAQGEIDRVVGGDAFIDRAFGGVDALAADTPW